ncbi:hypothetical protein L9G70_14270 [Morganella morganii]|uniref:hypothetical protein n=1 Tax=Morganella morganii TaxID=582 RepID=UPI00339CCAF0
MTDKTGGSAFPVPATELHGTDTGMTLRDYFAAKVMQGDWAAQAEDTGYYSTQSADVILDNVAELYYRMADAMLRAREK